MSCSSRSEYNPVDRAQRFRRGNRRSRSTGTATCRPWLRRRAADRRDIVSIGAGQAADEVGHQSALLVGQIDAFALVFGAAQRRGLGAAGVGQAQLVGTGRLDEIAQRGELELPAESADAAVGEPGHAAADLESRRTCEAHQPGRRRVFR